MSRVMLLMMLSFEPIRAENECQGHDCPVQVNTLLQSSQQGVHKRQVKEQKTAETYCTACETIADVSYANDNELQKADFYFPKGESPQDGWTTIIGLHGKGGWRKSQQYLVELFVGNGFQFVAIDWEKSGRDVQLAADFLDANRDEYEVNQIYLYGYSLGGTIATNVLLEPDMEHIEAVVTSAGTAKKHFKKAKDEVPPSTPTTLFIGCSDDPKYPEKWSEKTAKELKKAGVKVYTTFYEESCGHYPMKHHNYFDDVINFFKDPKSYTQDGNPSRLGYWETINADKACISNNEGIVPFLTVHTYNLETCQSLCQHNNDCFAVDHVKDHISERQLVWDEADKLRKPCHLYTTACTTPKKNVNGLAGGSYKWVDQES